MKKISIKKLAYTSIAALALATGMAYAAGSAQGVNAATSGNIVSVYSKTYQKNEQYDISPDTYTFKNGTKMVYTYSYTGKKTNDSGIAFNVKVTTTLADGSQSSYDLPWEAWAFDGEVEDVSMPGPSMYGVTSVNGKKYSDADLYSSQSSKKIKTTAGTLEYTYSILTENHAEIYSAFVESTFTDAKTGKKQHDIKAYLKKADADAAIKSGTAFVVNPYGTTKQTTVTNPKSYVPTKDTTETFKLGTGTLYASFKYGGGDCASYYVDNKTGIIQINAVGGASTLDASDGSIFAVNPYDPMYGGIISVTTDGTDLPAQGAAHKDDEYVTIKSKNYSIWSGFDFKTVKHYSKNYYQKTFHVKTYYRHSNGSTYLSLYDNKGKWFGYISSDAVNFVYDAQQGSPISANKYVTLTSKNYKIWSGFDFKTVKHYSKNYYQKTYHVKTIYNHFSGTTYLSLYDSKGKWFGYINQSGTKTVSGQQGIAITYKKTVTIKKSGYTIWGSFFGKKRGTTTKYKGKKLTAKVKYNCANGSTYLSLYSGSKWIGYVNDGVAK